MKFAAVITALIALVAPAAAFVPTGARTRGLTVVSMAYVPDGLTPAQVRSSQPSYACGSLRAKGLGGAPEPASTAAP